MKCIIFALPVMLFSIINIHAQGIYKTSADYESKTLSYTDHSIHTDIAFSQSSIKVVKGKERTKLEKSAVYGFKNKRNQDFRFFNNSNYKIIDPSSFYLYSREENVIKGKAKTRETRYYFSTDTNSPVVRLTILNLKKAFPQNRAFHDLLDLQFKNDRELLRYDPFHKEYKVKSIFNRTVK